MQRTLFRWGDVSPGQTIEIQIDAPMFPQVDGEWERRQVVAVDWPEITLLDGDREYTINATEDTGRRIRDPFDGLGDGEGQAAISLCGVVSASGRYGEPLACGHPAGHFGPHAWASLPTWYVFGCELGHHFQLLNNETQHWSINCPLCGREAVPYQPPEPPTR